MDAGPLSLELVLHHLFEHAHPFGPEGHTVLGWREQGSRGAGERGLDLLRFCAQVKFKLSSFAEDIAKP
jgi:hypothetical protein